MKRTSYTWCMSKSFDGMKQCSTDGSQSKCTTAIIHNTPRTIKKRRNIFSGYSSFYLTKVHDPLIAFSFCSNCSSEIKRFLFSFKSKCTKYPIQAVISGRIIRLKCTQERQDNVIYVLRSMTMGISGRDADYLRLVRRVKYSDTFMEIDDVVLDLYETACIGVRR